MYTPLARGCSRFALVEMLYRGQPNGRWDREDKRHVCRQHAHLWERVGWARIGWIVYMADKNNPAANIFGGNS